MAETYVKMQVVIMCLFAELSFTDDRSVEYAGGGRSAEEVGTVAMRGDQPNTRAEKHKDGGSAWTGTIRVDDGPADTSSLPPNLPNGISTQIERAVRVSQCSFLGAITLGGG